MASEASARVSSGHGPVGPCANPLAYTTLCLSLLPMPLSPCRLCGIDSDLQLSHILPAFAYRWIRESSGNGHVRASSEPNQRVQDGLKHHWLCASCEMVFSRSERSFAGHIFHPYLQGSSERHPYGSWLLHFCTSVSWRVLRYHTDESGLTGYEPKALERIQQAESIWRQYLLGARPHPGPHQQHLLPMDQIESTGGSFGRSLAPNINRYLLRAIGMDLCRSGEEIFTFAKLGRFIILGFVHEPNPHHWRGTKVNANRGVIEPKDYTVPLAFGHYLNRKAHAAREALDAVSDRQYAKIEESFRVNIDRYIDSDSFTAMRADVERSGDDAFSKR